MAFCLKLFLKLGTFLLFASCSTKVVCHPPKGEASPMAIVDHGRHTSLFLSGGEGRIVRYAYGDWNYYALAKTGLVSGARALFWPTQAGLGRKVYQEHLSRDGIHRALRGGYSEIYAFEVDQGKSRKLLRELENLHEEGSKKMFVQNEPYELDFAAHPETYWALNNSNQAVANWAEKLGCQTKGAALFSRWEQ